MTRKPQKQQVLRSMSLAAAAILTIATIPSAGEPVNAKAGNPSSSSGVAEQDLTLQRAAAARRVEQARVALANLGESVGAIDPQGEAAVNRARADVVAAERAFAAIKPARQLLAAEAKTAPNAKAPKANQKPPIDEQAKANAETAYAARLAVRDARAALTKAEAAVMAADAAAVKATDAVNAAKAALEKSPTDAKLQEKADQATQAKVKAEAEKEAAARAAAVARPALSAAQDKAAAAEAVALGGLTPIASAQWDYAKARHLLFRAGFGGTPQEVEKLVAMGPFDAVDHLVNYHLRPVANLEFEPFRVERAPVYERLLGRGVHEKVDEERRALERKQLPEMRRWWLRRMAESPRPLQEKLTLFWHDHFATNYHTSERVYLIFKQNELFRAYAGENFAALLHGIVQDPAMIQYLDNHKNNKGSGNENLGRELQELFSIGEEFSANHTGDGYTEQDVREASRALTGYTYDAVTNQFHFLGSRHDSTNKTVLGKTGAWSGDDVANLLLAHPSTAKYVCKKLFEYFAHRGPDADTVERLARVLRENEYEMRPMLRNLFLSEQFYGDRSLANHVKNPVELHIGTVRALGITQDDYQMIDGATQQEGMALFEPPNVAGWEDDRAWVNENRILLRYNHVANVVERSNVDVVTALDGLTLNTPAELVDHLIKRCLVTTLSESKRQALIAFAAEIPPSSQWAARKDAANAKLRALIVMIMSTPEYQVS